jgi:hypothetical protein
VLLVYPGVLYGSCCAKYAAAFFKGRSAQRLNYFYTE